MRSSSQGRFDPLQRDADSPPSTSSSRATFSFRSSPAASSSPLWHSAYRFVDGLQPSARYADRQRTAHKLATELARLHAEAPPDALDLLTHAESVGASMGAPLARSLLELAAEAEEAEPPDAFTLQLVLSCLTNMSAGAGVGALLRESDAVAAAR